MNYGAIKEYDIADGEGVRVAVYVSGCNRHCKGCHNEVAWDFDYGEEFTNVTMQRVIQAMEKPWIKGLSILGGEPFDNADGVEKDH